MHQRFFLSLAISTFICGKAAAGVPDSVPVYQFKGKISLPGDERWDYLKVEEDLGRLFVSPSNKVQVVDLASGKMVGEFKDLKGVHGIAIAKAAKKGYISNGGDNSVTVFDVDKLTVIKTIPISGKKPDAIIYDNFTNHILSFNGGSDNATVIDVATDMAVATIDLGGAPEYAVSDGKGLIYNNIEDKNEVAVIDAATNKVVKRYSLAPNEQPTGLTMDKKSGHLFSTCRKSKTLVVMDVATGKIIQTLPIGGGVDAVVYDKALQTVTTSNGEGSITIIEQKDGAYKVVQTVDTHAGLKTMAQDGTTHLLYLSGAEIIGKSVVPGSFGVYIFGTKQAQ